MMSSARIAFFSDVHGCSDALTAVLASIAVQGVTRLIFLGDVLGYGPEPSTCVRILREHADVCLLGNHDAMATDEDFDLSALSKEVAIPLELARRELAPEDKRWLAGLPLTWSGEGSRHHTGASTTRRFLFTSIPRNGPACISPGRQCRFLFLDILMFLSCMAWMPAGGCGWHQGSREKSALEDRNATPSAWDPWVFPEMVIRGPAGSNSDRTFPAWYSIGWHSTQPGSNSGQRIFWPLSDRWHHPESGGRQCKKLLCILLTVL
jgi:hypothetical protein